MFVLKRYFSYPQKISDIFHTSSFETSPPEIIMAVWNSFHDQDSRTVAKILSDVQHKIIFSRLSECPGFMFPINLSSSTITLMTEVQEDNCIGFSNIEDQDNSLSMIVRMFTEISDSKNIVPVRGDIIHPTLEKESAELVLNAFARFYLDSDLYRKYVEVFNNDFGSFEYKEFLLEYFKKS